MELATQRVRPNLNFPQTLAVAIVYVTTTFASSQLALAFAPETLIWVVYPAAALDLSLLLIFGLRWLPLIFVNTFVSLSLSALLSGTGYEALGMIPLVDALAVSVAYGGGAYLLLHLAKINVRLTRLYDVAWFLLVGSFVTSLVAALMAVSSFVLLGLVPAGLWLENVLAFWAGEATGIAMLAPLILTRQPWRGTASERPPEEMSRGAKLASAIGLGLILLSAWFAYGVSLSLTLDISYLVFVPLIWIATQGGFRRTTTAVFALNLAVLIFVQTGLTNPQVIALQFNLMTVSYVSLLLASVFSAYRRNRDRLRHSVYHDRLTDLPNRTRLMELLNELGKQRSQRYALLFINLDRFKLINDTYGQNVGDAFLILVGRRLQSCLGEHDVLARHGGDEFAVVLPEITSVKGVMALAEQLVEKLEQSVQVSGYEITIRASIGIATARAGDADALDILQKADTAMREAKTSTAHYVLFDTTMKERVRARVDLERDLKLARSRDELEVHFQPIVSLTTGQTTGHEALMRWNKGSSGYIPPLSFIPIAEETGLIHELSAWLMAQVLRSSPPEGYIAINLSVQQLQHVGFVKQVKQLLTETDFPAERLVFEVTESMMMVDLNANIAVLEALAGLGSKIALDDFGTGYASLSYLKRLPVHILKIDRSFLQGVPEDSEDVFLVRTILSLAQSLNLGVVAEGVESEAQEAFLREHGCQQVQGFLYGRPLPLGQVKVKTLESS